MRWCCRELCQKRLGVNEILDDTALGFDDGVAGIGGMVLPFKRSWCRPEVEAAAKTIAGDCSSVSSVG